MFLMSRNEKLESQDCKENRDVRNRAIRYPWLSTYSYCGGDPINAIDKNGKLIIFINGMHFGDGGRSDYWGSFFNAFVKAIGDRRALFFDGAVGGINGIFSNRRGISNHTAHGRYLAGKERGRKVAKSILGILKDNETIKFVLLKTLTPY